MGTENRACGIFRILLGIIAFFSDDLLRIVAGFVSLQCAGKTSVAFGIGDHFCLVIPHGGYRGGTCQYGHIPLYDRFGKCTVHFLDV